MREFDIFVPLFHNDGRPVNATSFQQLQKRLIPNFEGLTFFPQPNKGFWKMGGVLFQDEIVIYRVLSEKRRKARRFLSRLKTWMKRVFEQEEILIVERKVDIVP